jgi:hypothetical protein
MPGFLFMMNNKIIQDVLANIIGNAIYDGADRERLERKIDYIIALLEQLLTELSSAKPPIPDWRSDNHPGGDT